MGECANFYEKITILVDSDIEIQDKGTKKIDVIHTHIESIQVFPG